MENPQIALLRQRLEEAEVARQKAVELQGVARELARKVR